MSVAREGRPAGSHQERAVGAVHARLIFPRRVTVLADAVSTILPAGRIIDVGCGDGSIGARIMERRGDISIEGYDILVRPDARIPVDEFNGTDIPLPDDSAAACLLVDVLHHADDPIALLRDCARVAPVVVVKDHHARNSFERRTLAAMDWVGNRHHGVVLPYSYFSPQTWREAVSAAGLEEVSQARVDGLYPWPLSLVLGGSLHFVAKLGRAGGSPDRA